MVKLVTDTIVACYNSCGNIYNAILRTIKYSSTANEYRSVHVFVHFIHRAYVCECLQMHDTQVPIHTDNNIRYIFVSDSARCLWRWRQRACPVSACTHTYITYRTYIQVLHKHLTHTHTHLYYIHLNHAMNARGTTTSAAAAASAGASICKQWLVRLQQASVKFIRRFWDKGRRETRTRCKIINKKSARTHRGRRE